jgi:hypothetical protein
MAPHERNDVCKMEIENIKSVQTKLEGIVEIYKDRTNEMYSAYSGLTGRLETGHRRVDRIEASVISIDKSLTQLLSVIEEMRKIPDTLSRIDKMVDRHEVCISKYEGERKDILRSAMGFLIPIAIAALAGYVASHSGG